MGGGLLWQASRKGCEVKRHTTQEIHAWLARTQEYVLNLKGRKKKYNYYKEYLKQKDSSGLLFSSLLQRMEPISSDTAYKKFTDHELDKLLQDLNEFQGTVPMQSSHGIISSFGDFVDSFLSGNGSSQLSLQYHLTQVLHDFEEYETKMLPPCQRQHSTPTNNLLHYSQPPPSIATELQDTKVMIEEMTQGTQDLIVNMDDFHDSTSRLLNMKTPDHILLSSTTHPGRTTATLGLDASLSNLHTVSFQGTQSFSMTSFGVTSIRFFHCKDNRNIWRRRRRKYKGVMETEEQTASRLERTKIKNREAAAKAHQKKQVILCPLQIPVSLQLSTLLYYLINW